MRKSVAIEAGWAHAYETVRAQERLLNFTRFGYDDAWEERSPFVWRAR